MLLIGVVMYCEIVIGKSLFFKTAKTLHTVKHYLLKEFYHVIRVSPCLFTSVIIESFELPSFIIFII